MKKTCNHHKKMDGTIPVWLWFCLYFKMSPSQKPTEEKEKLCEYINEALKEHCRIYGIEEKIIKTLTEPNNHDALPFCDKCYAKNLPKS